MTLNNNSIQSPENGQIRQVITNMTICTCTCVIHGDRDDTSGVGVCVYVFEKVVH